MFTENLIYLVPQAKLTAEIIASMSMVATDTPGLQALNQVKALPDCRVALKIEGSEVNGTIVVRVLL